MSRPGLEMAMGGGCVETSRIMRVTFDTHGPYHLHSMRRESAPRARCRSLDARRIVKGRFCNSGQA
jgi:hypothetical protein